ncbi:three-Cys-motif partner protein TcmP [Mesorhizobium sp. AA23]|uniref:three-Cys-motif partner protein TcmP n=1 Tax=Mesorhizobium sp. AA23 TaxID=1854058 RepID=UPI0007FBE1EA|nr:three-Cys-motif partner protein TcmP [Mesorhizobium sp. AA23]OBQ90045.1 hypothetical protein A9K66_15515 [Mesorhizobium sp. AA23]
MGKLVEGDDGLPVEEVGAWSKEKIALLCKYVSISRAVRAKWIGPGKAGATYIDLFCGPGRSKIRRTGEFIEGGCVAAWNESVRSKTPFSSVYIADADPDRLEFARRRLSLAGAPVEAFHGEAVDTAKTIRAKLDQYALHFAFVDPYNLGAFDFSVIETLSKRKRIDMMVHISKMDLQRNTGLNVRAQKSAFDKFVPGWRLVVDTNQPFTTVRRAVFDLWKAKVIKLGMAASTDMQLITGSRGQHLYWLTLAARHELALAFWKAATDSGQGRLF